MLMDGLPVPPAPVINATPGNFVSIEAIVAVLLCQGEVRRQGLQSKSTTWNARY
jgi:hypothetical protein